MTVAVNACVRPSCHVKVTSNRSFFVIRGSVTGMLCLCGRNAVEMFIGSETGLGVTQLIVIDCRYRSKTSELHVRVGRQAAMCSGSL